MSAAPELTRAYCRVETDPVQAFQFLQLNGYPYFWSPDDLSRGIIVRVIDPDADTLGYVWGEWLNTGLLSFHVCARSGSRLPFFTSDLLDQLVLIGFWLGADDVETALDGHPNPLPVRRLLKCLGFSEVRDDEVVRYTLNTWSYLGQQQQQFRKLR